MNRPSHPRLALWPSIILVGYFCAALIAASFHTPLLFDAASNAIIPKNLNAGYGWATSYHAHNITPFLSSGPTIMLPCAILIALLGQHLWVPALSMALLDGILISILAYRLHRLCDNPSQGFALTAGILGILALCDNFWLTMLVGEIPALLLLLIAATLVADPHIQNEKRRYFLIGITAGLAFLCRLTAIPGFGALALLLLFKHWQATRQHPNTSSTLTHNIAAGLLGILVITVPFMMYMGYEIWRSENQGLKEYWQLRQDLFRYNRALGLGPLLHSTSILDSAAKNIQNNTVLLINTLRHYGLWPWLIALGLVTASLKHLIHPSPSRTPVNAFLMALLVILLAYASWYFPIPATWGQSRYALYPMLLTGFLLTAIIARDFRIIGTVVCLGCAVLLAKPDAQKLLRPLLTFQPVPWLESQVANKQYAELYHYHRDIKAAFHYLQTHSFRYPLANCGWLSATPEIEFLFPQPEVFLDCNKLIHEAIEPIPGSAPLAYRWKHPVNFTLVRNRPTWAYAEGISVIRRQHALLTKACDPTPLYDNPWYTITECRFSELAAAIPLTDKNPFLETRPGWQLNP